MSNLAYATFSSPTFSVEMIGPQEAADLLRSSAFNRPTTRLHVTALANTMRRGEWRFNGEPIIVASSGEMLDGHHRARAIIASGCTIQTAVIRGVNPESFDTIDIGRRRSGGDILAMRGEKNYIELASAIRGVLNLSTPGKYLGASFTPRQIEAILDARPDMRYWVKEFRRLYLHKFVPVLLVSVVALGVEHKSQSTGDFFLDKLSTGAGLERYSPILMLRDRFLEYNKTSAVRMSQATVAALSIKAWNAYITNRPIKNLRLMSTEDFPILIRD